ncbi:MMPL family transporter [Streptomyces radicis]|uniref:MMPL family transporter n=1 Tax=Streptomyces radicis TaxID=1750517 RepID=A0A3A9WQV1_9ACTN|nr:MMPL family transporter [Streptomyces radicis]RKN11894.1 MMPL family transporter [Streptomyces radicis]RKN26056.1 MMPL family transporter [Streptomyces radicis]
MERFLDNLGRLSARRPWHTLGCWLIAAVALLALGQSAGTTFVNDLRSPGAESQDATDVAREHIPEFGAASAQVVWRLGDSGGGSGQARDAIDAMLAEIAGQPDVAGVDEPVPSPDGHAGMAGVNYALGLDALGNEHYERLEDAAAPAVAAGVDVEFRGMVVDLATGTPSSTAEYIGLAVAAIVLVVAFGSVVAAGLPLLVAGLGIAVGMALVLLAGTVLDMPAAAPVIAMMLGLGAGIDYALFVLTRFRTDLAEGGDPVTAAGHATAVAGHAAVYAGGTVVLAILGLHLAGIPFVGALGTAAAITVALTVVATVTALPALLGLLGHRVDALPLPALTRRGAARRRSTPRRARGVDESAWTFRWGRHVQRHRVLYVIGSTALLLLMTLPLLSLRLGTPDDGSQPGELTQRRAYDIVTEHWGAGWNAPLIMTVRGADEAGLRDFAAALETDPEVRLVDEPRPSEDGEVAIVTAVPHSAPQDEAVTELVHRIRDDTGPATLAASGGEVLVGGPTAVVIDLAEVIGERLPWVVLAVVGAGMLLLFAMFRAPLIALKAALMTLLSIGVSFGVVTAVFQWGWGIELLGLDKSVPIVSAVPMLLFAVLFGLSMDYEVFLLSAIRESYDHGEDAHRAVVSGIGSTARVITCAAIIMAVVFFSFSTLPDTLVKMAGIGLATAVVIDATLIRMVLVPALMSLLGDRAWWRPLSRPHGHDRAD